jgi:predicted DNA-binding WGR domain protein
MATTNSSQIIASVLLHDTSGNRNAEYRVELHEFDGGANYKVVTKWGAIGKGLQEKVVECVLRRAAEIEYTNAIAKKTKKNYQYMRGDMSVPASAGTQQRPQPKKISPKKAGISPAQMLAKAFAKVDAAASDITAPGLTDHIEGQLVYDDL